MILLIGEFPKKKILNSRNFETGRTLLHQAAAQGNRDITFFLLKKGCNLEVKTILVINLTSNKNYI